VVNWRLVLLMLMLSRVRVTLLVVRHGSIARDEITVQGTLSSPSF
jgi:hypothetical protein